MLLLLLLDNNNLVWVIFNEGRVWPVFGVCARLQSLVRGAETFVCSSGGGGGGGCSSQTHSRWISVPQDPLALQGAEVAIVCVIAIKGGSVINRSSKDGWGRVERGGTGSRGGGGRRGGSEEATAGRGAIWLPSLPQLLLLMLLLLVRGSNLRQRPQFGFDNRVLRRPRRRSAIKAWRRFTGVYVVAVDEVPGQILALTVEVVEMMEVVVVVVVMVMTENWSFYPQQWRRCDWFGWQLNLRVVVLVLVVLVAFVDGLVRAQLPHTTADLLHVRLSRAGMVRQSVHMQANTWDKRTFKICC